MGLQAWIRVREAPHTHGPNQSVGQVAKVAAGAAPDWYAFPKRSFWRSFWRATRAATSEARVLCGHARWAIWAKCLKALRFRGGQAATLYVRVRAHAEEGSPYIPSGRSRARSH